MSTATNTFENVKATILLAHKSSTSREKSNFYNSWANNYDQVRKLKCIKMISAKYWEF